MIAAILVPLIFIGVFGLIFALMFWFYGMSILLHFVVDMSSVQTRAVVLEVKKSAWGWYSGGQYSQSLMFQPVQVKLEIHPENGVPYIATDWLNAKPLVYHEKLKPGAQLLVSVSTFSQQLVASKTETIVEAPVARPQHSNQKFSMDGNVEEDPKARLVKLKELFTAGLITEQEFNQKKQDILEEM